MVVDEVTDSSAVLTITACCTKYVVMSAAVSTSLTPKIFSPGMVHVLTRRTRMNDPASTRDAVALLVFCAHWSRTFPPVAPIRMSPRGMTIEVEPDPAVPTLLPVIGEPPISTRRADRKSVGTGKQR